MVGRSGVERHCDREVDVAQREAHVPPRPQRSDLKGPHADDQLVGVAGLPDDALKNIEKLPGFRSATQHAVDPVDGAIKRQDQRVPVVGVLDAPDAFRQKAHEVGGWKLRQPIGKLRENPRIGRLGSPPGRGQRLVDEVRHRARIELGERPREGGGQRRERDDADADRVGVGDVSEGRRRSGIQAPAAVDDEVLDLKAGHPGASE